MPPNLFLTLAFVAALTDLRQPDPATGAWPIFAAAEPAGAAPMSPDPAPPPPSARARLKQANLFADLDYPPEAIVAGAEGSVEFELSVGPNGRVMRCAILVSSGSSVLDSETCRMIRVRARFVPALDFEGRTTWDSLRGGTVWRLPR